MIELRIYVACLASYNNGVLHGKWIDATQDADEIRQDIAELVLATSPYPTPGVTAVLRDGSIAPHASEEWAIHDYEGFDGIELSEYEDIDTVAALAAALEEHGPGFAAYWENDARYNRRAEFGDVVLRFEDAYCGEYDSEQDYAEDLVDDCGMLDDVPQNLRYYFDYGRFARDLFLGGDYWSAEAPEGGIYVFRSY